MKDKKPGLGDWMPGPYRGDDYAFYSVDRNAPNRLNLDHISRGVVRRRPAMIHWLGRQVNGLAYALLRLSDWLCGGSLLR